MPSARLSLEALSLVASLVAVGCGEIESAREGELPSGAVIADSLAAKQARTELASTTSQSQLPGHSLPAEEKAVSTAAGLSRKIIYSATVDLVIEDFSVMPERVAALVKKFDAYIAGSDVAGTAGTARRGMWKIRVPIACFDEFVSAAKDLGELVSANTTSQDVSEEYYDVDARIRNKTKEEERMLNLLEERPSKLEDVIAIERELSRVREELERMQGRLRVLHNMTSMTTVQLTVSEVHGYEPPQAATFTTRLGRAFDGSLAALQTAGEVFLIAIVAVLPWLPVLVVVLVLGYFSARTLFRLSQGKQPAPTKG